MLVTRVITAAVGIPLVAAAIWVGGGLLAAVVAVAVFVAVLEVAAARGARAARPTALALCRLAAAGRLSRPWQLTSTGSSAPIVLAVMLPRRALRLYAATRSRPRRLALGRRDGPLLRRLLAAHFVLLRAVARRPRLAVLRRPHRLDHRHRRLLRRPRRLAGTSWRRDQPRQDGRGRDRQPRRRLRRRLRPRRAFGLDLDTVHTRRSGPAAAARRSSSATWRSRRSSAAWRQGLERPRPRPRRHRRPPR